MIVIAEALRAALDSGARFNAVDAYCTIINAFVTIAGFMPRRDHYEKKRQEILIDVAVPESVRKQVKREFRQHGWELIFYEEQPGCKPCVGCFVSESADERKKFIASLMEEAGHKLTPWVVAAGGQAEKCQCSNHKCGLTIWFEKDVRAIYRVNGLPVDGSIICPAPSA